MKQSAPNTYQRSQKDVPQNLTATQYLPEAVKVGFIFPVLV
jgi:hypothetical protein